MEFQPFPKIPRLNRPVVITEKIDGTNATVYIGENGEFLTASRNRWITPDDDNYGFSAWAHRNMEELLRLGPGWHRGEWWGAGIQKRYTIHDRRMWHLFNVSKWTDDAVRPACCGVVPVLATGMLHEALDLAMRRLSLGSFVDPACERPEGVVVYHNASGHLYKVLCENDGVPKGLAGGGQ